MSVRSKIQIVREFHVYIQILRSIGLHGDQNIKEVKNTIIQNDGYVTIIKKSEDFEFTEKLFTIDDTKLMISKKIKESFDPRGLFNPGKMYKDF